MTKTELEIKTEVLRAKIEQAAAWTNDADALEMVELFPHWETDRGVIVGERLQYNDVLYKCIQAHITQADWTPDVTPALWVKVSVDEWPEWVQPQGAADSYQIGDKVTYKGKHYICIIANNVWSPEDYPAGWELVE